MFTGALTRDEGKDVGDYAITQGTLSAGDNYVIDYTGANLTITKRTLTVTADPKSKKCGKADPALTYHVDGLVDGDEVTVTLTREEGWDLGVYAINADIVASDNYEVIYKPATFTIREQHCELCGKIHNGAFPDNLIGVFHGLVYILTKVLTLPFGV